MYRVQRQGRALPSSMEGARQRSCNDVVGRLLLHVEVTRMDFDKTVVYVLGMAWSSLDGVRLS